VITKTNLGKGKNDTASVLTDSLTL